MPYKKKQLYNTILYLIFFIIINFNNYQATQYNRPDTKGCNKFMKQPIKFFNFYYSAFCTGSRQNFTAMKGNDHSTTFSVGQYYCDIKIPQYL